MKKTAEPSSIVFVVDDDAAAREAIESLLRSVDLQVATFGSASEFLRSKLPDVPGCLVLDVRLPGLSGLDFQTELGRKARRNGSAQCRQVDGRLVDDRYRDPRGTPHESKSGAIALANFSRKPPC
jgi:DNA-binding NtrC family response regulator